MIPVLRPILFLSCEHTFAHRDSKIWSALEDFQVACIWSPLLRDLNPRGTSTNDSAALALDVDTLIGPER